MSPDHTRGPRLPEHLEERTVRFRSVLQHLIKEKNFCATRIGALDELPLHLSATSIKERRAGHGTALLRNAGIKGSQATVVLAATAAGQLLPPLLILKVCFVKETLYEMHTSISFHCSEIKAVPEGVAKGSACRIAKLLLFSWTLPLLQLL